MFRVFGIKHIIVNNVAIFLHALLPVIAATGTTLESFRMANTKAPKVAAATDYSFH